MLIAVGPHGDADLRAQAAGHGVELGVRDFNGLNLGSGVHDETALRMDVPQGGAAKLGIAGGPLPQARAIRFRTPWRDPGGAKDQITERARHPVGRRSQRDS